MSNSTFALLNLVKNANITTEMKIEWKDYEIVADHKHIEIIHETDNSVDMVEMHISGAPDTIFRGIPCPPEPCIAYIHINQETGKEDSGILPLRNTEPVKELIKQLMSTLTTHKW